jgi:hypothetical protein
VRASGAAVGLWVALGATAALAHPSGFHKRVSLTVSREAVTVLAVMDVDQGQRCSLLRSGADVDGDGQLSPPEAAALADRLVGMMLRTLKVDLAGYALPLKGPQTKLSLRDDRSSTKETGLSVAALIEVKLPSPVLSGMQLTVEDASPDLSPVLLEVFQDAVPPEAPLKAELENGRSASTRLGEQRVAAVADAGVAEPVTR